jgi:hypothetical protein
MSGVQTTSAKVIVNRSEKKMSIIGTNWLRDDVSLTITGFSPATSETMVLLGYRGPDLVLTCQGFTGTTSAAAVMDTNTTELVGKMAGVPDGATRAIKMFLWDTQSLILLAQGVMDIIKTSLYSASSTTTPITGSTMIWGNLAFFNNGTYVKSTDGFWYPFSASGSGTGVREVIGTVGIVIPGG